MMRLLKRCRRDHSSGDLNCSIRVDRIVWVGVEHDGWQQPLRQVRECEAVDLLLTGSGSTDHISNLRL